MELLWALATIAILAATPSVMFLLFWRLLVAMRDDALIENLRVAHGVDPTKPNPGRGVPGLWTPARQSPTRASSCPNCGAEVAPAERSCDGCGFPIRARGR